jgi:hypothetical protein
MHESNVSEMDPENMSSFLNGMAQEYAIDVDMVTKMFMTYKKYQDILFSDSGISVVEEYDVLSPELYRMTYDVLMDYMYKNYNGKEVFNQEGIDGEFHFMDEIEFMKEEEMYPEISVGMNVTGSYTYTYTPYRQEPREETTTDVNFYGSVYLPLLPYKKNGEMQQLGYDFMNHSHEVFGDWMKKYKGIKHYDIVDSGKIKGSFIKYPKNYSEAELKRYTEQWIEICKRIIRKNMPMLLEFKDFIEHDGGVFEGYNRKRKTIK